MAGLPSQPDISIIFANWNTKDYLRDCIHSIHEQTKGLTYEIIVVDDGSTDGTAEMLKNEFPDVLCIENGKNIGVAKTYNKGFAIAKGRFIQMLNTDMILVMNAVKVLYDFLCDHPEAGAAGAWLRNKNMTSQISYGAVPSFSQACVDALFLNDLFPSAGLPNRGTVPPLSMTEPLEVEYVTGAGLLIRREIFDTIGSFDERYTSYCEDVDFCYRVRNVARKKLYFVPASQIVHFGGVSFSKVRKYQIQLLCSSYDKFLTKFHNRFYSLCTRLLYAWHYFIKMVVRAVRYLISSGESRERKRIEMINAFYTMRYSIAPKEEPTAA